MRTVSHGDAPLLQRDVAAIWRGMWSRCTDPESEGYKDYGGRGIEVCERWRNLDWFIKDMGPRPSPSHTLDRADNEEGYYPQNCRWATWKEQQRNRRNNHMLEFCGWRLCLSSMAEKYGIRRDVLGSRLRGGWSLEDALLTPARPRRTPEEMAASVVGATPTFNPGDYASVREFIQNGDAK